MSRSMMLVMAALSAAVVIVSSGLVIAGAGRGRDPSSSAAAIEVDEGEGGPPDPTATGVIAARANGYVYRLAPDGKQLGMAPDSSAYPASASAKWQAFRLCQTADSCQLMMSPTQSPNQQMAPIALPVSFYDGAWSPKEDAFAALTSDNALYLVQPDAGAAQRLAQNVTAFEWSDDGSLVFATWDGGAGALGLMSAGVVRSLGAVSSPVVGFVASPDGRRFAFAQDGDAGWRLTTVDQAGSVRDLANLGRMAVSPPVARAPQVAISWSPDGSVISISPAAAPFAMYVLRSDGSDREPRTYYFKEGYAGEMKWSPDGRQLAISTYSLDRSQHRIYVLESTADKEPRRLIDGCLIFWSPDGRFLVAKPEPYTNSIAAVRVSDAAFWTVSEHMNLTPAAWGADEQDALKLAQLPARGVGGLGK